MNDSRTAASVPKKILFFFRNRVAHTRGAFLSRRCSGGVEPDSAIFLKLYALEAQAPQTQEFARDWQDDKHGGRQADPDRHCHIRRAGTLGPIAYWLPRAPSKRRPKFVQPLASTAPLQPSRAPGLRHYSRPARCGRPLHRVSIAHKMPSFSPSASSVI